MTGTWNIQEFYQDVPEFGLDDIAGRESWKKALKGSIPSEALSSQFYMPQTSYFLLCGECGVGKETLAQAFAGELGKYGYRLLSIYVSELIGEDTEQTKARIRALFQEMTAEQPLVVILLELEELKDESALLLLRRKLNETEQDGLPVVLIAATEQEKQISPKIKKLFSICHLDKPDVEEREAYFKMILETLFYCEKEFGSREMAELTDGLLFAELDRVVFWTKSLFMAAAKEIYPKEALMIPMIRSGQIELKKELFQRAVELVKPEQFLTKSEQRAQDTAEMEEGTDKAEDPEIEAAEEKTIQGAADVRTADSSAEVVSALAQLLQGIGQTVHTEPEKKPEEPKDPAAKYRKANGELSEDINPMLLLGMKVD